MKIKNDCKSVEEVQEINRTIGLPGEYRQLKRGPYDAQFDILGHGDFALAVETAPVAVHMRVDVEPNHVAIITLTHDVDTPVVFNNRVYPGGLTCMTYGPGAEIDIVTHGRLRGHQLIAPFETILETAHRLGIRRRVSPETLSFGHYNKPGVILGMHSEIQRLVDACRPDGDDRWAIDEKLDRLIEIWATELFDTDEPKNSGQRLLGPARLRALNKALEWMHANIDARMSLADICEHACVSGRTLERLFRAQFGVTPAQYGTALRLRAARAALQNSEPGATKVSEVAARFGFLHAGRFSINYAKSFGESPKITLGFKSR